MSDYITNDTELTSIADAIRTKGGTSASLVYPSGFISAIEAIPTGATINNQNKTVSSSETDQTVTYDSGYTGLDTVSITGLGTNYVGSGIDRRDSTDLSLSGTVVTAPSGYYGSNAEINVEKTVPSGYTRRNYIEALHGDAYINTGIKEFPNAFTAVEFRLSMYNAGSRLRSFFGYQGISSGNVTTYRFSLYLGGNNLRYYGAASGESNNISGWLQSTADTEQINDVYVSMTANSTYPVFTVNNTTSTGNKKKTSTTNGGVGGMTLMTNNYQATGYYTNDLEDDGTWLRMYRCKIYYYGGIVRDYVPCTRDSDGVAGFYDLVNDSFKPSTGTNAFTYG